jgi:hypothetical protein
MLAERAAAVEMNMDPDDYDLEGVFYALEMVRERTTPGIRLLDKRLYDICKEAGVDYVDEVKHIYAEFIRRYANLRRYDD